MISFVVSIQMLLSNDILIIEQVANLDNLPSSQSTIVIGLIKIEHGSGGPARVLGLVDTGKAAMLTGNGSASSRSSGHVSMYYFLIVVFVYWSKVQIDR